MLILAQKEGERGLCRKTLSPDTTFSEICGLTSNFFPIDLRQAIFTSKRVLFHQKKYLQRKFFSIDTFQLLYAAPPARQASSFQTTPWLQALSALKPLRRPDKLHHSRLLRWHQALSALKPRLRPGKLHHSKSLPPLPPKPHSYFFFRNTSSLLST